MIILPAKESHNNNATSRSTAYWIVSATTIIFLIVWLEPVTPEHFVLQNYAPWHTMVEIFSVVISSMIFVTAWQARLNDASRQKLRLLGTTFLAVALLDMAHLLSYAGMPQWVTPSGQGKGIHFWFAARYAGAFGLLMLVLPLAHRNWHKISARTLLIIASGYIAFFYWIVLAEPKWLPLFIIPGKGLTHLKIALEWGLIIILVTTLGISWRNRKHATFYEPTALMLALWLSILSELCFTLYSNVAGIFSILGHFYKVGAYAFLYQGIVFTGFKLPYRLLEENQQLLLQLTNNINQVFWLSSADKQQIHFISPAYEEIWGRTCQSLISSPESWLDAIHPDDRDRIKHSVPKQAEGLYEEEYRIVQPDGTERWVLDRAFPIRNTSGQVDRLVGFAEDITLRKQLQQAIADRERSLRNLVDNLPSLVAYWDKSLQNVYANKSYANRYGYSLKNITGMHMRDVLGEKLYEHNRPYIEGALKGEVQQFERTTTSSDGKTLYSFITYAPDITNNEINGIYSMVSDITAVKEAEQQLRDNEALLSSMISVMADGVVMQDKQDRILTCNPAAEQILGLTRDQLMGLSSFDPRWRALHEDGEPFLPEEHPSVITLHTGMPQQNVIMGVHKPDNTLTWISINSQPVFDPEHQEIQSVVVSFHDITDRKQAQAEREILQNQLMQAQKMESIGHLTGGIAHDFNNMLGAILGYTELLKQVCAVPNPPQARLHKYLEEILIAGGRAKELIAQMLVFSRLNPESQGDDVPVILLQPVIKEVAYLLRSSIPSSMNVNYCIPDEGLRTRIHPVQLHQIVLNLAINARDAIDEYGSIDITLVRGPAEGICSSCHQGFQGEYVDLTVHDNGHGIEPNLLSKIFDPFYTTKDIGKGTGMGLSVVHGIVHAVGGHITVTSIKEKGTSVRVLLPISSTTTNVDTIPNSLNSSHSRNTLAGMRIMVVDDEQAMATMIYEFLSLQGAMVRVFTSSMEALTTFEKEPYQFDLIITDETMPNLTGLDMAKTMLKQRATLPIILVTGYSEHATAEIAIQQGIAGFMLKPIDFGEMINLIKRVAIKS